MVGSIGAASGYDNIFAIGYSPRIAAARSDFQIPESALTGPQAVEAQSAPAADPVQDSVELSRDYPQLVVGQTYAPPMEQQIAFAIRGAPQPSGMADSEESFDYLNDSNVFYDGLDSDETVEDGSEAQAVADGENGEEAEAVDETGREQTDSRGQALSEDEQREVRELADRDREVRAHEQAHKSVGGQYAGGMSFEYQQGPDGQRYAVGGEVSIDISAEKDPAATVSKMQQVKAAAMAPAEPSAQDFKVAAEATQLEAQARQELSKQSETGETEGASETGETESTEETGEGGAEVNSGLGGLSETASGVDGTGSAQSVGETSSTNSTGSVASLSSTSNTRAAQRYQQQMTMASAQSAYQTGGGMDLAARFASPTLDMTGYRPINIVA